MSSAGTGVEVWLVMDLMSATRRARQTASEPTSRRLQDRLVGAI